MAATSYSIESSVLLKQADLQGAIKGSKKALGIREDVLGMYHPDTAASYQQVGEILFRLGDRDSALEFLENGLAIREYLLGSHHPETVQSQKILHSVYVKAKQ